MTTNGIIERLNVFSFSNKEKIDIKSKKYLETNPLNVTNGIEISKFIEEGKIDTGNFLFGFEQSIIFFENGFFSRNSKSFYQYNLIEKCEFKELGLLKSKRLVLQLRYSFVKLDIYPYKSKFDLELLNELKKLIKLDDEEFGKVKRLHDERIKLLKNQKEKQILELKKQKEKQTLELKNQKEKELNRIKIQKEKQKDISRLIKEVSDTIENIKSTSNQILIEDRNIDKSNKKIDLLNESIKIESLLKTLPSMGTGSITFYNHLIIKRKSFNDEQFNKIVRFLTTLENVEETYREFYKVSCINYFEYPKDSCYGKLLKSFNLMNNLYVFCNILVKEVDNDFVLFSKVYNELEDKGMFLSEIDLLKLNTLIDTNTNLKNLNKNVSKLTKTIENGFTNLSYELNSISDGIDNVSVELMMGNDLLSDFNMSLYK